MTAIFCQKLTNLEFEFNFQNELTSIQPEWDDFLPENHHLKSANLLFLQNNTSIEGQFVRIFSQNDLVGVIYLQKAKLPITELGKNLLKNHKIECFIQSITDVSCNLTFWICGNLFRSNQEGYFFKENIKKEDIFKAFVENLDKNELKISGLLMKECCTPFDNVRKLTPFRDDASMQMAINPNWSNIEDYIKDLDKKYRKRFVKIHESAAEIEKRELNISDLEIYKDKIYDLYNQVFNKQDFKFGTINPDYFIELKKLYNEKVKIYGFFKDSDLLAFTTHIFEEASQMEIHYIGLDYDYNKQYNLYFNILQFGLEMAILERQKTIELGRTSTVAKASLGATPSPKYNYLYFRRHWFNWSFQIFLKRIYKNIEEGFEQRSPFANKAVNL